MILLPNEVELPYRAKVHAPNGSSTNGFAFRYFLQFDEAARCPGRIGPPEYAPGNAKGPRPYWLRVAQRAAIRKHRKEMRA